MHEAGQEGWEVWQLTFASVPGSRGAGGDSGGGGQLLALLAT